MEICLQCLYLITLKCGNVEIPRTKLVICYFGAISVCMKFPALSLLKNYLCAISVCMKFSANTW